jgi:hypothetical protein
MSNLLKEAVLGIVKEVEEANLDLDHMDPKLRGWFGQLKLACKMTPDEPEPQQKQQMVTHGDVWANAQKEAREMAEKRKKEATVEEKDVKMTICIGGENDGTAVPTPPNLIVGAKLEMDGQVYVFSSDRQLVYSETETKKRDNLKKEAAELNKKKVLVS